MFYKKAVLLSILISIALTCSSQDILGRWYAKTTNLEKEEHYLLDLRKGNIGYLDLPASNTFRVRLDSFTIGPNASSIYGKHEGLGFDFEGQLDHSKNIIKGLLKRNGLPDSLVFSRTPSAKRSQQIQLPIPYLSEDIHFYNNDSTKFSGTLTMPRTAKHIPAVILVSGSGPQNRDEEILGHQPFKILADHLTRNGIAVLRYDDRGYGQSEGQFRPATSMDYTDDALAAIQFLKNYEGLHISQLGVVGHSEGGNIAPVAATLDTSVSFMVLLAAPGVSNLAAYLVSLDLILKEYPETYDRDFPFFKSVYTDMATIDDKAILKDSIMAKFKRIALEMEEKEFVNYGGVENYINSQVAYHTSDWYHHFLQFDVTPYLKKLGLPILALNGDKDNSIVSKTNLEGFEKTLKSAGNSNYKLVELEHVNHFFQVSENDKIESVYFNEETFSKNALTIISNWINALNQ